MSSFEIALLIVIVYICVFALVNRICKCAENCALAKAYGTFNTKIAPEQKGVVNEVSEKC